MHLWGALTQNESISWWWLKISYPPGLHQRLWGTENSNISNILGCSFSLWHWRSSSGYRWPSQDAQSQEASEEHDGYVRGKEWHHRTLWGYEPTGSKGIFVTSKEPGHLFTGHFFFLLHSSLTILRFYFLVNQKDEGPSAIQNLLNKKTHSWIPTKL